MSLGWLQSAPPVRSPGWKGSIQPPAKREISRITPPTSNTSLWLTRSCDALDRLEKISRAIAVVEVVGVRPSASAWPPKG